MAAGYGDESIWRALQQRSSFAAVRTAPRLAPRASIRTSTKRARELLGQQGGYRGEKLVFLSTHDFPWIGQQAEVAADAMRRGGLNIDLVWSDWGTTIARVTKQDAPDKGGWNLFLVTMTGPVMVLPLTNPAIDMTCARRNLWGWSCDEAAERKRQDFIYAPQADRAASLVALHRALADAVPYRVLGQAEQMLAFRRTVTGVLSSPVIAYWNIDKQ